MPPSASVMQYLLLNALKQYEFSSLSSTEQMCALTHLKPICVLYILEYKDVLSRLAKVHKFWSAVLF